MSATEEPVDEVAEPCSEEAPHVPHVPVFPPKNPLLFPPRGPGRPHLRQVLSAPDLHTPASFIKAVPEFREHYNGIPMNHQQTMGTGVRVHQDAQKGHGQYRKGLETYLKGLEKQTKKKNADKRKRRDSERAVDAMKKGHALFLESTHVGKEKPPWTYTDPMGYFENPLPIDGTESLTCSRNQLLCGIYNIQHPDYKPPHAECNVYGGWNFHTTNARNEALYEFRDKEFQGTPMSPGEKMFKDRLDRSIDRITRETNIDALNKTTGSYKKGILENTAHPFSALKREKAPWNAQAVSTHTYFHEYPPYDPGDHPYETALPDYIFQSDRGMSCRRQVVAGRNQQKSFWNCPKHNLSGTNVRQTKAQEMIFRNTRGCFGLKPPSPTTKRHILLKGTGSLSFTHFKDALIEPMERFSPGDRSEPP